MKIYVLLPKILLGNISMINANVAAVNAIISDVAVKIQDELNKQENSNFTIRMGSLTGSRLLSGRGPKLNVRMSTIGNIDTDLRSEFSSTGINQTLHRIYLQVECEVVVLTPINTVEQTITNQVLIAEAVIVGTTPDTYYNLEGMIASDAMQVMQ